MKDLNDAVKLLNQGREGREDANKNQRIIEQLQKENDWLQRVRIQELEAKIREQEVRVQQMESQEIRIQA